MSDRPQLLSGQAAQQLGPIMRWAHGQMQTGTGSVARFISDAQTDFMLVICKQTNGESGSTTTPCTYGYAITTLDDTTFAHPLATDIPVLFGRTAVGKYTAAPRGSYGIAFSVDSGGIITLFLMLVAGEVPAVTGCNCA